MEGFYPGVKHPVREAGASPPSSAKVKNEWSYTSASPAYIHGVHNNNFTFTFIIYVS
jgi:hypothetical protein